MSLRSERQVSALRLAQQCCELGARCRTIHHVTGLAPRELRRLFFADARSAPRGRAPDSPEWYHGANLLNRAEASIFVSIYRRLRTRDFTAAEALVGAYGQYRSLCQPPYRISFDRAFDLASHIDGIWVAAGKALSLITCSVCHSESLATLGEMAPIEERCPFCRLLHRYDCDSRLQASFPHRSLREASEIRSNVAAILQASGGRAGPDAESHLNRLPLSRDDSRAQPKNGLS